MKNQPIKRSTKKMVKVVTFDEEPTVVRVPRYLSCDSDTIRILYDPEMSDLEKEVKIKSMLREGQFVDWNALGQFWLDQRMDRGKKQPSLAMSADQIILEDLQQKVEARRKEYLRELFEALDNVLYEQRVERESAEMGTGDMEF